MAADAHVDTGPGSTTTPLSNPEAFALIDALGPFEPEPFIAVGVSGGPDSTALLAILVDWAQAHQGKVIALCVDHGLRAESGEEADAVMALASRLGALGEVLTWSDAKPVRGIQASARDARTSLLADACRRRGILHLFLAHHLDDQIETVAMRRARQSGPVGLAGMATVSIKADFRILRPFLGVGKARLEATAVQRKLPYFVDPSNSNPAFERGRLRAEMASPGIDTGELRDLGAASGQVRKGQAWCVSKVLASATVRIGQGWITLSLDALQDIDQTDAELALSHVARSISGGSYLSRPPPEWFDQNIRRALAGTLSNWGGCLWHVAKNFDRDHRGLRLTVCREARRPLVHQPLRLPVGKTVHWDGRFVLGSEIEGLAARAMGKYDSDGFASQPNHDYVKLRYQTVPLPRTGWAASPVIIDATAPQKILYAPEFGLLHRDLGRQWLGHESTPTDPPQRLSIRYAPAFPLIEAGLRLEASPNPPYIPS